MRILFILLLLFSFPAHAALPGQDSKQPIAIDADSLEVFQKEKTAVFSGKVVAKQGNITLNADRMKVFYGAEGDKKNAITKIEVTGNVIMTSPSETAKGSLGVFDTVRNMLTLTGDVVLTRGANIVKGSTLTVDMNSGKSQIAKGAGESGGRVRGLFVPEGN